MAERVRREPSRVEESKRRASLRGAQFLESAAPAPKLVIDFARRLCEIALMAAKSSETVLVVDDDPAIVLAADLLLAEICERSITATTPAEALDAMSGERPGLVLLDLNYTRGTTDGQEGLDLLTSLLTIDPECVVVVITAHADVGVAVEALKRGATDFILKPWTNDRLLATVHSALMLREARRSAHDRREAIVEVTRPAPGMSPLLGSSPAMRRIFEAIERAAPTDANILLLGENGTGKELVANEIHRRSLRCAAPMLSVDLGSLGASLIESELFGHVKGAFTDARSDRVGRFQAASGGTLFLDEVANLALHMQPKLLTVLEQRRLTPVGSNRVVAIDVRIISATNQPREKLQDDALFRQDLKYRLNTIEIELPPLRERQEDIPLLLDHYIDRFSRKYGKAPRFVSRAIIDALCHHPWPGNVRELRHAAERAVIMAHPDGFSLEDFAIPAAARFGQDLPRAEVGDLNLEQTERRMIEEALRRSQYNVSRAATALGLTRHSLYRRMEKHGL